MSWRLTVRDFQIAEKARPLSLDLGPGGRLAILGTPGSGKSRLLEAIARAAPDGVPVTVPFTAIAARRSPLSAAKPFGSKAAAESLGVLGLWERRREPSSALGSGQLRALALLPVVAAANGVLCVDGGLDTLDPWQLPSVLEALMGKEQCALAIVTARPDVAEAMGRLAVLGAQGLRFFGTAEELLDRAGPARCELEASNSAAVAAVCGPLGLQVNDEPGKTVVRLDGGMADAARILASGYGSIRAVIVRRRTVAEALQSLP